MKIIFTCFDKKAITNLPRILFPGKVVVVDKPEDTEAAVNELLSQKILGVDTETRPSFKRGQGYRVSLLQVSTHDTCYLFRLHLTGMTPAIIRLLEDTVVPKIGLSWHDDLMQLHKRAQFTPGNFVELQDVAKKFGIKDMSLQKLYANLFHQKISKAQRLSNWEASELREAQQLYAATDAWCCILLYEEFLRLTETGDYELDEFEAK
ncbi:MAG TPA: 3'-5' exonuclease [Prevotellaceae bacterium]|nr:3'-5' exonuclease [Prevotellaceae bacterium]